MDTQTLGALFLACGGAVIGAMWALLKGMVTSRLDRIEAKTDRMEEKQDDMVDSIHDIDSRVKVLERTRDLKDEITQIYHSKVS